MSKTPIPAEYSAFEDALKRVVSVSKKEVEKRLKAERVESASKLVRPGPKPKFPSEVPQPTDRNS